MPTPENTTTIQAFAFDSHAVRVVEIDGQPWFVAKDVCACLEIDNHRNVVARLDEDEKGVQTLDTLGREVLAGRKKCLRGMSHNIAVLLGMKRGQLTTRPARVAPAHRAAAAQHAGAAA